MERFTSCGENNPRELSSNANAHFMDVELQEAESSQLPVLLSLSQYILFFVVLGMILGRIGEGMSIEMRGCHENTRES